MTAHDTAPMIDPELLELLRCPETHARLVLDGASLVSTDPASRRRYRIEDGFPVMLVEESDVLDETTWREIMRRAGTASDVLKRREESSEHAETESTPGADQTAGPGPTQQVL